MGFLFHVDFKLFGGQPLPPQALPREHFLPSLPAQWNPERPAPQGCDPCPDSLLVLVSTIHLFRDWTCVSSATNRPKAVCLTLDLDWVPPETPAGFGERLRFVSRHVRQPSDGVGRRTPLVVQMQPPHFASWTSDLGLNLGRPSFVPALSQLCPSFVSAASTLEVYLPVLGGFRGFPSREDTGSLQLAGFCPHILETTRWIIHIVSTEEQLWCL